MLDIDLYIVIYIVRHDDADGRVRIVRKPVKTRKMWVLGGACRPTSFSYFRTRLRRAKFHLGIPSPREASAMHAQGGHATDHHSSWRKRGPSKRVGLVFSLQLSVQYFSDIKKLYWDLCIRFGKFQSFREQL